MTAVPLSAFTSLLPGAMRWAQPALFYTALILFPRAAPCDFIPIGYLHSNDSQGVPSDPYGIGTEVEISGIITAGTGTFAAIRTELYIQDTTGGMLVYRSDHIYQAQIGDSAVVHGAIAQFNGTTEVVPSDVQIVSAPGTSVTPLELTCADIERTFNDDFSEPNESRLVRVRYASYDASSGTISDGTGTCMLHIDYDTGIELTSGTYHISGIVKQWDNDLPFTDDYQLLPRSPNDIEQIAGPEFLTDPREEAMRFDGFDVHWMTDVPATSGLLIGQDQPGDLVTIEDTTFTTDHLLRVESLEPATIYRVQAASANEEGENRSRIWYVSTASAPDCSGSISVFFTEDVEAIYADGDSANGNAVLERRLQDRINAATHSIDACLYNISVTEITNVLIAAHNRGVRVRVIYEADNEGSEIGRLMGAGIPVLNDECGENSGDDLMHNKFFVFDFADRSSAADDYVWTGSANITYYGFYENAENVIVFQDQALAGAYTAEFEEMWGGNGAEPDAAISRFGDRKTDNIPHRFLVGATPVELYMSPSDGLTEQLGALAASAESALYFSIFNFTSDDLSDVMKAARDQHGLAVAGVFDLGQASSGSEYWPMSGQGAGAWFPPADVHLIGAFPSMHHKYLLVDADNVSPNPSMATGSFNWTYSAETGHDENIVFIHDERVVNLYLQEFMARYHQAGGADSLALTVGRIPDPAALTVSVYPNPWGSSGQLSIQAPGLTSVELYDVAGRREASSAEVRDSSIRLLRPSVAGVRFLVAHGPWGDVTTPIIVLP